MPRRRFGVGSIGPEFSQDPGIVSTRHPLGLIGETRVRIHVVTLTWVATLAEIVESPIPFNGGGKRGCIANRSR